MKIEDASCQPIEDATEEQLRLLWDHGRDILTVFDEDGTWRWSSPAGTRLLGYEPGWNPEGGFFSMVHPDDVDVVLGAFVASVAGERSPDVPVVCRVRAADGSWRWYETTGEIRLDDPFVSGILLFSRDVSDRETIRGSRSAARDLFEKAFIESPVGMVLTDEQFVVTRTNPAIEVMFGYSDEEVIGRDTLEWVHQADESSVQAERDVLRDGNVIAPITCKVHHADGRWIPCQVDVARLTGSGGGYIMHVIDLSYRVAAAERLSDSEARYRLLVESASDVVLLHDDSDVCQYASPSLSSVLGYQPDEVVGRVGFTPIHEDDVAVCAQLYADAVISGADTYSTTVRATTKNGDERWLAVTSRLVRDGSGTVMELRTSGHDVTELHRATEALESSERRFRNLLLGAFEYTLVFDLDGTLTYVSPNAEHLTGGGADGSRAARGMLIELLHLDDRDSMSQLMDQVVVAPVGSTFELRYRSRATPDSNEYRWMEGTLTNLSGDPDVAGIVLNAQDVTDKVAIEERLAHQAVHDELTGLSNRAALLDQLERLGRTGTSGVAVLFCDLDRFKTVNDTLGHEVGDRLLQVVARRLTSAVRPGDIVARFGGDEFVVACTGVDEEAAVAAGERLCAALVAPVQLREGTFPVSASVGIACWDGNRPVSELIRDADTAMYVAKAQGRGRAVVFDISMHEATLAKAATETRLRHALATNELHAFYQIQVRLDTGRPVGFEALVRWEDPERGLITPDLFLSVAGEAGLLTAVDRTMLTQALDQLHTWRVAGWEDLRISVNCSRTTLALEDFSDIVADELAHRNLPAASLTVEVTEDVLVGDDPVIVANLVALHAQGVALAVDDFGTGYSGLSQLKAFPASALKIDKAFVSGLGSDRHDAAIVAAILAMADSLGLEVCAEGVETDAQRRLLEEAGCHIGQGHLYGKAVSAREATELLEALASGSDTTVGGRQSV